ncbi:hypothetical protein KC337_g12239 [Hortaea werneckii]|nr:hypothetical protein KC350_g8270 [Hortaea werneckii]KAI6904907.1 hypothetical protein KC348_g15147 [Hortaea werneckii]KAI7122949.1 hypothetical protein KC337_g12239 [Hortaea werneckii]KAI7449640.1 hypothetical protein KC364_g12371 [Hortaea werneckii]
MSKQDHPIPPGPPPLFVATAQSLLSSTATILARATKLQDDLVERYTPETATFSNVVLPLGHSENARLHFCQQVEFLASVSPDDSLRAACREASKRFTHFETDTGQRADLHRLVAAVNDKDGVLSTERKKYVNQVLATFEDRCRRLSVDDARSLERIEGELSQLKHEYLQTCRQESGIWLAQDELEGVDSELLCEDGRSDDGSRLRLPFQGIRWWKALSTARRSETRRKIYTARALAAESNVPLLERAIVLRTQKARLLGYGHYMQMTMRHNLIKAPAIKMIEEYYDIDADEVSQYFEMSSTVQRTLKIFEGVFGISFAEIDDQDVDYLTNGQGQRALTWHPDVLIFAAWNAPQGGFHEQPFLGYLYLDLFCRPGKCPGFCDLPINPGFTNEDGNRVYPSTCLLCNFDKPTGNSHRFLQHQEVAVLFHELGHGIHDLVAKTEFARFHGASTAEDFNEAPSQMLEHWCWHPEILKSLGQLHQANDEFDQKQERTADEKDRSMPDHLIERLLHSSKDCNAGLV